MLLENDEKNSDCRASKTQFADFFSKLTIFNAFLKNKLNAILKEF